MVKIEQFINNTINDLDVYLKKNNIHDVVIGVSGGVDSAVSLALLSKLPSINIHAYFIDIESSSSSLRDAKTICEQLKVKLNVVSLKESYEVIIKNFDARLINQQTNIKARLRMLFLYNEAFLKHAVVVGNSNFDELYLGYFTKYADNAADIMLLNTLTKTEIYELAKYFNLSQDVINKSPSADLYDNQTDEKEFGFKYHDLDEYLLDPNKVDKILRDKIFSFHEKNLHKTKVLMNQNYLSKKELHEK